MKDFKLEIYEKEILNEKIAFLKSLNLKKAIDFRGENININAFYDWRKNNSSILNESGIKLCSGVSKAVFIFDDLESWVIKVPFLFNPERNSPRFVRKDPCAVEADVYNEAKEEGIEQYFAGTYFFTEIDELPIYIQERAICNENDNEDIFYSYASENCDWLSIDCEDEEVCNDTLEEYIENMTEEERIEAIFGCYMDSLISFISKRNLNDFHGGNFGFINGNPVLIDYCGY